MSVRRERLHPRRAAWRPRGDPPAATSRPAERGAQPRERFRADIQGLRAIAVLLVLAFHLWPDTLTGGYVGVDVFFVISGFLITGHLLQHPPRRGRDLLEFWGRRIRRLLPAAFLVLAVTAIASRLLAPDTRWGATAGEIIASALYVQNWALAGSSVDYLAAAEAPTPVQHYWSLSVEEQFYLLWPVLILGLFWLAARTDAGRRLGGLGVTRLVMLLVIGASLLVSITATATEPASAYFITQTRIWELAAGGFVSTLPGLGTLAVPGRGGRKLPVWAPTVVAWSGVAMIVAAGVTYTTDTPFPGSGAVLPVLGTALVILAAATGGRSPTRLLAVRPVQHIGDTSYSIYLWHWPLIVLWPYVFDRITPIGALAIIGLTVGLATLSKVFVEDAFRFSPSMQALRPTFRFAIAGMLVLSIAGGAQLLEAQSRLDQALASAGLESPTGGDGTDGEPNPDGTPAPEVTLAPGATPTDPPPEPTPPGIDTCLGAASMVRGFDACPQDPAGPMVPSPIAAATDRSDAYRDGCFNYAPFATRKTCTYGKGPIKVALVGNSHGGQWLPAMQALAKRDGWTLTTFIASQCNVTDAPLEFYSAAKTQGCLDWGRWVMQQTKGDAFDLVVISERQSVPVDNVGWSGTSGPATAGFTSYLQRWSDAGTKVVVLQDTPFPNRDVGSIPDCLARHPKNQLACAGTWDVWHSLDPLFAAATATPIPGVTALPTRQYLCTDEICPAVIGTYIAYFDGSHMTATYARSIAPFIEPALLAALGTPPTP